MTKNDHLNRPSSEFLDGFAAGIKRGLLDGLDLASDPCDQGDVCPTPPAPSADQRPIAGADDDLTSAERDLGDQQPRDLGDDDE